MLFIQRPNTYKYYEKLDNSEKVKVIFLDLANEFDTVNYKILISILSDFRIDDESFS